MQFNFIQHNLGHRRSGEIVQVKLSGSAANVRLLDSSNFSSYKSGRNHRYYGGLAQRSPVRLQIPYTATWYVAVDMQGLRGTVRSSIEILPSALPPIQEAPLASVPSLVRRNQQDVPFYEDDDEREFDVFISHASEDKDEIVRPLATALRDSGLKVWYDEFELKIGDSLRRKIDKGLAASRFGVVVLSKNFLAKGWANYELDGLVTRTNTGEQILLPIWHNISKKEVIDYSPSLADKLARNTSNHTVEEIAKEIAGVILQELIS
jgi:hypothetical protein